MGYFSPVFLQIQLNNLAYLMYECQIVSFFSLYDFNTEIRESFFFNNEELLVSGRQIGLKFHKAIEVFLAKL